MEPMITVTSVSRWNARRISGVLVLAAQISTDTAKCADFIPQTLYDHIIRCLSGSQNASTHRPLFPARVTPLPASMTFSVSDGP